MKLDSCNSQSSNTLILPFSDPGDIEQAAPTVMKRGEGCHVVDEYGNQYLEMMSGLWCAGLGFSNRAVTDAITSQLETLPFYHGFLGKAVRPAMELADRLVDMSPEPLSRVLFANSGSEAIDTAVKIVSYFNNARGRPEKKKIIVRDGAYHGAGTASAALTAMEYCHHGFDVSTDRVIRTGSPSFHRCGHEGESERDFAKRRAHELDRQIESAGAHTVAAFVAEPIQASGGVIIPPAEYWSEIRKVLDRHDVLFVSDEVVCGFHRTGQTFGCETFGIRPDMMVVAKQLSAGFLPISAVLISDEIHESIAKESHAYGVFGYGYTYSGHPVTAAGSLAVLDEYDRLGCVDNVRRMEPILASALAELRHEFGVADVRSIGLLGGVELDDTSCRERLDRSASEVATDVVATAEDNGVILRPVDGVVAFCPPMIVEERQINDACVVLGQALRTVFSR